MKKALALSVVVVFFVTLAAPSAVALATYPDRPADATGSVGSWTGSATGGFGAGKDNLCAVPLAVYQGKLYAGVMNGGGAQVWRRKDDGTWEKLMEGGFGSKDNAGILRMQVFGGYLYAGTINLKGCGLWRYDGSTSTWTDAISSRGAGFGDAHNIGVTAMEVLNSTLYVGTLNYSLDPTDIDGAQIWSSTDGTTWTQVIGQTLFGYTAPGFGDSQNLAITSLRGFNSALYAGTARFQLAMEFVDADHVKLTIVSKGCELWRRSGTAWSRRKWGGFGDDQNVAVAAMEAYGGRLYVGTTNGGLSLTIDVNSGEFTDMTYSSNGLCVYAYNSSSDELTTRVTGGFGDKDDFSAIAMCVTDVAGTSKLVVGAASAGGGGKLRTYDGHAWLPAAEDGFGSSDNSAMASLAVLGDSLFAGTFNSENGCEVWYGHPPTLPKITSISPTSGVAGTEVTIKGSNFGDAPTVVDFHGKPAGGYPVWTPNEIKATAPAGVTTGAVTVTTTDGTSNGVTFTVILPESPPHVSSISPTSGKVGTVVALVGSDFGETRGSSCVRFAGAKASSYAKWTESRIEVKVPSGASSGKVKVTTGAGTSNGVDFMVKPSEPAPPAPATNPTWFLAEGTTNWGFTTYISIENPNASAVHADITYMTGGGAVPGGTLTLQALSQTTVNPADKLGAQDFSTRVTCTEGKTIAVDRTMTWRGQGAASEEAHSSIGVTSPAETWYLPEGSAAWGFECWLLVQNPNPKEATCTVTYMIEGVGPRSFEKKVPGNSRKTFNMADDIGPKDASIKVQSDMPVIPERAMYRDRRREGHDSIGTALVGKDCYLAEGTTAWGFTTYVLIQNPSDFQNEVTVTYMTTDGPVAHPEDPIRMPPNSRKTIRVNDVLNGKDFSTRVHGTYGVIAERAMYWGGGTALGEACHDSVGMTSPHTTFYLPDGQASSGRETWTLVQNPNPAAVSVEISYLTAGGKGDVKWSESIPANSRKTFGMADKGIGGRASIMVRCKTSGRKIMVERAMYWNSRGAGTDTIGGFSD